MVRVLPHSLFSGERLVSLPGDPGTIPTDIHAHSGMLFVATNDGHVAVYAVVDAPSAPHGPAPELISRFRVLPLAPRVGTVATKVLYVAQLDAILTLQDGAARLYTNWRPLCRASASHSRPGGVATSSSVSIPGGNREGRSDSALDEKYHFNASEIHDIHDDGFSLVKRPSFSHNRSDNDMHGNAGDAQVGATESHDGVPLVNGRKEPEHADDHRNDDDDDDDDDGCVPDEQLGVAELPAGGSVVAMNVCPLHGHVALAAGKGIVVFVVRRSRRTGLFGLARAFDIGAPRAITDVAICGCYVALVLAESDVRVLRIAASTTARSASTSTPYASNTGNHNSRGGHSRQAVLAARFSPYTLTASSSNNVSMSASSLSTKAPDSGGAAGGGGTAGAAVDLCDMFEDAPMEIDESCYSDRPTEAGRDPLFVALNFETGAHELNATSEFVTIPGLHGDPSTRSTSEWYPDRDPSAQNQHGARHSHTGQKLLAGERLGPIPASEFTVNCSTGVRVGACDAMLSRSFATDDSIHSLQFTPCLPSRSTTRFRTSNADAANPLTRHGIGHEGVRLHFTRANEAFAYDVSAAVRLGSYLFMASAVHAVANRYFFFAATAGLLAAHGISTGGLEAYTMRSLSDLVHASASSSVTKPINLPDVCLMGKQPFFNLTRISVTDSIVALLSVQPAPQHNMSSPPRRRNPSSTPRRSALSSSRPRAATSISALDLSTITARSDVSSLGGFTAPYNDDDDVDVDNDASADDDDDSRLYDDDYVHVESPLVVKTPRSRAFTMLPDDFTGGSDLSSALNTTNASVAPLAGSTPKQRRKRALGFGVPSACWNIYVLVPTPLHELHAEMLSTAESHRESNRLVYEQLLLEAYTLLVNALATPDVAYNKAMITVQVDENGAILAGALSSTTTTTTKSVCRRDVHLSLLHSTASLLAMHCLEPDLRDLSRAARYLAESNVSQLCAIGLLHGLSLERAKEESADTIVALLDTASVAVSVAVLDFLKHLLYQDHPVLSASSLLLGLDTGPLIDSILRLCIHHRPVNVAHVVLDARIICYSPSTALRFLETRLAEHTYDTSFHHYQTPADGRLSAPLASSAHITLPSTSNGNAGGPFDDCVLDTLAAVLLLIDSERLDEARERLRSLTKELVMERLLSLPHLLYLPVERSVEEDSRWPNRVRIFTAMVLETWPEALLCTFVALHGPRLPLTVALTSLRTAFSEPHRSLALQQRYLEGVLDSLFPCVDPSDVSAANHVSRELARVYLGLHGSATSTSSASSRPARVTVASLLSPRASLLHDWIFELPPFRALHETTGSSRSRTGAPPPSSSSSSSSSSASSSSRARSSIGVLATSGTPSSKISIDHAPIVRLLALLCDTSALLTPDTFADILACVTDSAGDTVDDECDFAGRLALLLLCLSRVGRLRNAFELLIKHSPHILLSFSRTVCGTRDDWALCLDTLGDEIHANEMALETEAELAVTPEAQDKKRAPPSPERLVVCTHAYLAIIDFLSTRMPPQQFLTLLPARGAISLFLPYIEKCYQQHSVVQLKVTLSADATAVDADFQ